MRKTLIFILSALCLTSCFQKQEEFENNNFGNFEALWNIIDMRYCYLDYKKINWDSVYNVYSAQVNESLNKRQLFDLLGEMLNELKDGHVNLYSSFDVSRYRKWFTDYPDNFNSSIVFSERYLGDKYRTAGGMRYRKIANESIGYIYYSDFSNTFSGSNINNIFEDFSICDGLIIDVRNNGGGYVSSAEQLASYFFEDETTTGYIQHKTGYGHNDFSKPVVVKTPSHKQIQWRLPMVILTNRMSYSATNDFVCRMKYCPIATIIGDFTGGGGGMPISSELPNGWMVRFSATPMLNAEMQHTEWGIEPDIKINMLPADERIGIDTMIEKAIEIIRNAN